MFFAFTELTILEDGTDEGVCVLMAQEVKNYFNLLSKKKRTTSVLENKTNVL